MMEKLMYNVRFPFLQEVVGCPSRNVRLSTAGCRIELETEKERPELEIIQNSLPEFKTRFNAALALLRIDIDASFIDTFYRGKPLSNFRPSCLVSRYLIINLSRFSRQNKNLSD
jgi:hypothetical protein